MSLVSLLSLSLDLLFFSDMVKPSKPTRRKWWKTVDRVCELQSHLLLNQHLIHHHHPLLFLFSLSSLLSPSLFLFFALSTDTKWPCVLLRTPDNKAIVSPDLRHRGLQWTLNGYACFVQDVRGRYKSTGKFFRFKVRLLGVCGVL